jgi:hypothetical protein
MRYGCNGVAFTKLFFTVFYVQIAASEEMMQFLKDYFPYVSRFSSFLRRRLFKCVTPNFIINGGIPMLSSVLPSIHLPMHLCICTATRCSENNYACKLTTWESLWRVEIVLWWHFDWRIFGGKRNESWMGCGNTVHFSRSYTLPENCA